jgi:hypothetical protein
MSLIVCCCYTVDYLSAATILTQIIRFSVQLPILYHNTDTQHKTKKERIL